MNRLPLVVLVVALDAASSYALPEQPLLFWKWTAEKTQSTPTTVGRFESEETTVQANVLTAGQQVLLLNPTSEDMAELRLVNRQGIIGSAWTLPQLTSVNQAKQTRSGLIWCSMSGRYPAFAVKVYRPKQQKPVLDWTQKLPPVVRNAVDRTLNQRKLKWRNGDWTLVDLQSGGDKVHLVLWNPLLGQVGNEGRTFHLTISENGSRVEEARVLEPMAPWPILLASGETAYIERQGTYRDVKRWGIRWPRQKTLWIIDKTRKNNPLWSKIYLIRGAGFPQMPEVDGSRHIFIPLDNVKGRSLTVLDAKGRLIDSISTTPYSQTDTARWIYPALDGKGYYRSQISDKGLSLFYHPLPK